MAATVDSAAASISLSKRRALGKKRATVCMKGTLGSPHGWMYLTFRWFKTSKLLKSCRPINNTATGYNKNTKQMRCWATKSCSYVKGRLCLHQGWDRLLRGLVWDPWREESEGHRPQWWLTFDTQSPALWSESHCLQLATYQVCDITRASTLSTISGCLGSCSC